MPRLGYADREDLRRWADNVAARSEFPRLVRRLVLETGRGVVRLDAPAGEGVSVGGWDGVVRATEPTPFVPAGLSVWELSVDQSVGSKADADYAKRTSTPDGTPTAEATYVAALLRPWTARGEWARGKAAEGRWREVRAYGLDDVEAWLEVAPVTHGWISELLDLGPLGHRDAASWWRGWAAATTPETPPPLLLAGRLSAASDLRDRLAGPPGLTTVGAASYEEARAFVAAVVAADEDPALTARTTFVDEQGAWRRLVRLPAPLVLVPVAPETAVEAATASHHHVVVPVSGPAPAAIQLPALDPGGVAEALLAAGLESDRRAGELGRLARRSLVAMRRRIANHPELAVPDWGRPPADRLARAALLAGRWDDRREADQSVLASLAGVEYGDLRERLAALAVRQDPFVVHVGSTWSVVSPHDAWLLLHGELQDADLDRFAGAVQAVLGEPDPALDLHRPERWRAGLEGKERAHSAALREGIASTLVLLAMYRSAADASGRTGVDRAERVVDALLEAANADPSGRTWAALARQLPLLAEAAPDAVLEAVRVGASGEAPVLATAFQDAESDDIFAPGSPHSWILWALETLAWSPDHFPRSIDMLGRLSALDPLDPAGRMRDRPFNSLVEILRPWRPGTTVPRQRRLAAIDRLRQRQPAVARRLMLALLPQQHQAGLSTREPEFRDWAADRAPVTVAEFVGFVDELARRLAGDANGDVDVWEALLERLSHLPPGGRGVVVQGLAAVAEHGPTGDDRDELWQALRSTTTRHREFAGAPWALGSEEVERLEVIASALVPEDEVTRHAWLFAEHLPSLGDRELREDFERYDAELARLRRDGVAAVFAAGGLEAVRRLAAGSVVPWAVGQALAAFAGGPDDADVLALLEGAEHGDAPLARAFAAQRFVVHGWPWVEAVPSILPNLGPGAKADILLGTGDFPAAWEAADRWGGEVSDAFWRGFIPQGFGPGFPHVLPAARRLREVGRHAAVLRLLSLYRDREHSPGHEMAEIAAGALDDLAGASPAGDEMTRLDAHDFRRIFELLARHEDVIGLPRIARLEWTYLPVLGLEPAAATLQRLLAEAPGFFVEVVGRVYRSGAADDDPAARLDAVAHAERAWRLMSSWSAIPGTTSDGAIDGPALRRWVHDARRRLGDEGLLDTGDGHIGQVLAAAPAGTDGVWPCEPVRELLEDLESDAVERGMVLGRLNRRGSTSRGLEEGGERERVLVASLREDAARLADECPRAAAVLRLLADQYEGEARWHDIEAERVRSGLY